MSIKALFFHPLLGTDFYHIAYSFFFYGCACWFMECVFESIRNKRLIFNRGFNVGPFCTIYGVAYLFVYTVLRPLNGKWILLYIIGTIYATVLEYITAVLLEKIFHQKLWDYAGLPLQFQGRICLPISLAWGLLIILFFAVFQPFVTSVIDQIPRIVGYPLLHIIIWIYFIDLAYSFFSRSRFGKKVLHREGTEEDLLTETKGI